MILSDFTAIITLINIDEFEILKFFTKKIILPKDVYDEICLVDNAKDFIDSEIEQNFIEIENYKNIQLFQEINILLDIGESASITIAIEKELPLIIDEKKGRRFAQNMGVEIIGLIGIIKYLYVENRIDKNYTLNLIEKLNNSDFRISPKLLAMILD